MNPTGKAVTADERLKRAQAEVNRALSMPEPNEPRAHGAWIKKRRSCARHAEQELRAAKKQGARGVDVARIEAQVQHIYDTTRLRSR